MAFGDKRHPPLLPEIEKKESRFCSECSCFMLAHSECSRFDVFFWVNKKESEGEPQKLLNLL